MRWRRAGRARSILASPRPRAATRVTSSTRRSVSVSKTTAASTSFWWRTDFVRSEQCLAGPEEAGVAVGGRRRRIGRLPCHALDFINRRGVFQRRRIAEFFAEISGTNDAPHDFGISCFGNVADEQNFFWSERFAKLGGERV